VFPDFIQQVYYKDKYKGTMIKRMPKKAVAGKVLALLAERYPHPATHLAYKTPWELLAATMLAAQCTDERVNSVTPALFARWSGPGAMAGAAPEEVEVYIRPTGFFRNKARSLVGAAQRIIEQYGGEVPKRMEALISLPGVARKTANVVLFGAYGINGGIAVDTHVGRISYRLGLTAARDPIRAERDLVLLFPRAQWGNVNHRLVWFGRQVCTARSPACSLCEMAEFCPKNGVRNLKEKR
jgi:endonuclease-3